MRWLAIAHSYQLKKQSHIDLKCWVFFIIPENCKFLHVPESVFSKKFFFSRKLVPDHIWLVSYPYLVTKRCDWSELSEQVCLINMQVWLLRCELYVNSFRTPFHIKGSQSLQYRSVFFCVNNFNFSWTKPLSVGSVQFLAVDSFFKKIVKRKTLIIKTIKLLSCLLTFCQYLHLKRLNLDQLLIYCLFLSCQKAWYGFFRFRN